MLLAGVEAHTPPTVAVKCIDRRNLTKRSEDNIVQEIALLLKLQHPHVVQLVDFYVCLEWISSVIPFKPRSFELFSLYSV